MSTKNKKKKVKHGKIDQIKIKNFHSSKTIALFIINTAKLQKWVVDKIALLNEVKDKNKKKNPMVSMAT